MLIALKHYWWKVVWLFGSGETRDMPIVPFPIKKIWITRLASGLMVSGTNLRFTFHSKIFLSFVVGAQQGNTLVYTHAETTIWGAPNVRHMIISNASSTILIPVYQYEHPNSGTQKNKKAVKILFIISSSSDWLFYFWHQDVTIYVTILRSLDTKSEMRRRIKKTMKPSMWLQINITTCIIHYIWCLKKSYTALLFLLKLNADPLVHGT